MRVVVVTNMYPTETHPGSGTFIADQVRSLEAAGVEIDLLFVDRPQHGRQVYRELADRIRDRLSATAPDLVHVMYGGVMARVVTRAVATRPVLVSFCGDDLLGSRGNGVFKAMSGQYNVLASRSAASRAAGIIVKSRVLFDALPTQTDKQKAWILPNGVDFARFRPLDRSECRRRLGWDPSRRHVLFPAPRARPEKRFALAAAGVDALAARGFDVDLHTLEDLPHDEVPISLNAADVVVLTSGREGSPNAVKEALACNVPVVSLDVGDVLERIGAIEGCFLAAATPDDIAAKLARVLERDERLDARARVAELALDRVAAKLKEIYGTVSDTDRAPEKCA